MSREYIVQSAAGLFLTHAGKWSAEYPDARIFPNLQAAQRTFDGLENCTPSINIYWTEDYAAGRKPTVTI